MTPTERRQWRELRTELQSTLGHLLRWIRDGKKPPDEIADEIFTCIHVLLREHHWVLTQEHLDAAMAVLDPHHVISPRLRPTLRLVGKQEGD
jgi:hypothetical protein